MSVAQACKKPALCWLILRILDLPLSSGGQMYGRC